MGLRLLRTWRFVVALLAACAGFARPAAATPQTALLAGVQPDSLVASQTPPAGGAPESGALPSQVNLQDVMRLLDDRSPRTLADNATLDVSAADRITAATLPNPSISYGGAHLFQGLSTGAVTQHQVVVEQPLLMFHQRQARGDVADLNLRADRARVAETLADRHRQARQAFATLLSRQQQLQVLQEGIADLERVEQVVRGRSQAGERSQYDLARIETETERFRIDLMNAETDVADASGRLASLLGFPQWQPRAVGSLDPEPDLPTDADALWTLAQARRPSLQALRERQAAARGGLNLARRERLPVPALSGGTLLTHDVTGTSAFFGFSMPLLVFDKGQGPLARAAAQVQAETLALTAETSQAHAEVDRARLVLVRRREALTRLETGVVRRVPDLRRMAEANYREGTGDILELLDAMRSMRDIRLAHVQQLEMAKLAEGEVIAAVGLN
jgi:cobalt-zinc-cadmium efflux system outer membrane protein